MKKLIALFFLALPAPAYAGFGGQILDHFKEKIQNINAENITAIALLKAMPAAKVPYAKGVLLSQMQSRVTTSQPAIALLCEAITARKAKVLYPYVHDKFPLIADYIDLRNGTLSKSSWDTIEEILHHGIEEFYPLVPDWALSIAEHATDWKIFFFERLFVRQVIEWEREVFYDLLINHFYDLLTEHDKEVLGLQESDTL